MARFDGLTAELSAVNWADFTTAYEAPDTVPLDLRLLLFGNEKQALEAAHRLWCGLCHQHAYLSSAAEPALPFLLAGLRESNDRIRVEILDILVGFVLCQEPSVPFTRRLLEGVLESRPFIEGLRQSDQREVADFAEWICESIDQLE